MFKNFIEQTLNAIQTGSIYALIALGYTMVYGIVKLINFAHGDILMVGAYITYLGVYKGFDLGISIVFAIVFCAILGVLIEKFAYKPLRNSTRLNALITAIGVSFLLQSLALIYFKAEPKVIKLDKPPFYLSNTRYLTFYDISISYLSLFIILISLLSMICLYYFIKKTNLGKATRAVSQDMQAAKLMGIDTDFTISLTFAIGSSLGALGGALYALMYPRIDPYMGILPGLKAFIAAVFGGIGFIPGAMIGGYAMGFLETYVKAYISTTWANPIVFGILILVLLFRPNGLFGKNVKEKV